MPESHPTESIGEIDSPLRERLRAIRLIVFDVDGTLTDGGIVFSDAGDIKHFNVQDGAGLKFLQQAGIQVGIISSRKSALVDRRAAELGIQHVAQGAAGKGMEMERMQARLQIQPEQCAAMGDDLPDLAMFSRSGVSFAPADAVEDILLAADYVTRRRAGHGAAREVAELILKARGQWEDLVSRFAGE